jgi:hypothetical protein
VYLSNPRSEADSAGTLRADPFNTRILQSQTARIPLAVMIRDRLVPSPARRFLFARSAPGGQNRTEQQGSPDKQAEFRVAAESVHGSSLQ